MEVVEGIHQVDGVVGGPTLIVDDDGITLVDTGVPDSEEAILGSIEAIGRGRSDLRHVLLTHADGDHIGSLPAIVQAARPQVYAPQGEAEIIEGRRPMRGGGMISSPVRVDHVVKGGDRLPIHGGIRVIETFGHTAGHVSYLLERENLLIAGDALGNTNGLAGPNPEYTDDMDEGMRTVAKIAGVGPESLCFGHGAPIVGGAAEKLRALASE